jgi:hypothetical protein
MTPDERQGRRTVIAIAAATLIISAITIGTYVVVKGPDRLPSQVVRFVLTVGLMLWLYRGSAVAKWIVIVLFGMAGLFGLLAFVAGNRLAATVGAKIGALYLALITPLLTSPAVDAFLRSQRAGGPRDSDRDTPAPG